jgi:uncharacterized protein
MFCGLSACRLPPRRLRYVYSRKTEDFVLSRSYSERMKLVHHRGSAPFPGSLIRGLSWLLFAALFADAAPSAEPQLRVLILSGQNNHEWRQTTPKLKSILAGSGRFTVDVTEHPEKCDARTFAPYDVLLSDWNTFGTPVVTNWPEVTRAALLDFVRRGKGFVVVHAGGSSFYDWPEYQQVVGGFWKLGETSHGAPHEFTVKASADHPVTGGVAPFKTTDELWVRPGLAPGVRVIATGDDQPVALTTAFVKGRGFTILMGHSAEFMNNPGFQALLLRGTEWACTGKVTVKPNTEKSSAGAILESLSRYRFGDSRKPVFDLENLVAISSTDAAHEQALARELAALLAGNATLDAKRVICGQLSLIGSAAEVPDLAKLLSTADVDYYARLALERIPAREAESALLAALTSTAGAARIPIINSLGARRSTNAVPEVGKLLVEPDPEIVRAAIDALGRIGGQNAATALLAAEPSLKPPLSARSSAALLQCAETLVSSGNRRIATDILERLTVSNRPPFIRAAAFVLRINALGAQEGAGPLSAALSGNDQVLQAAAIRALRTSRSPSALDAAMQHLEQYPPNLQLELITVLADPPEPAALPALTKAASSKDPEIRKAATMALGLVGNASTVPVLAVVGAAPAEDERRIGADALARLRGRDVDATILSALKTSPLAEQRQLIRAVVLRRTRASVPVLLELASTSGFGARTEAIAAVGRLGDTSACPGLASLLEANPESAASAMVEIGRREGTAKPVLLAFDKAGPPGKAAILEALPSLGGPEALESVLAAAESDNSNLRFAAVRALSNWPDAAPLDGLAELASRSQDPQCKALALRGIARLAPLAKDRSPRSAVEIIIAAMKAGGSVGEQKALLAALGEIPQEASLKAAQAYIDDPAMGAEARAAVAQIKNFRDNRPAPAFDESVTGLFQVPNNLCRVATATNLDGLVPDGQGQGPFAAIDGDPSTYWDETDNQPLYALRVQFKSPSTVARLLILGYQQQNYAPKDFEVLCDGKVVKKVEGAEYQGNLLELDLPRAECRAVELRITGYYGQSPAIRELGVFEDPGAKK